MSGSEPSVAPRRIGLLGGTFDPPHLGHTAAALEARRLLDLDLVVLVVANDPWQKTAEARIGDADVVSPADVRLAMTRAAVVGLNGIRVDDVEIRRGGPSYTAETLAHFSETQPGADLFLLLGSDIAPRLDTWVRPDEVRRRTTIVVMKRPGFEEGRPPAGWEHQVLHGSFPDLASTDLRERFVASGELDDSVASGVAELIRAHGLYGIGA
ncbi:MAG: nicotinate (nicotinamide) nucleotide adenylyltransferase [Acidimicrobiales bacterium]|nr:nicotinate (nicotinamide) nucleotide adenylyltransferase [Acidimicrobiaceae bacterium]MBT5207446.1 nicotinate (nicotinamide) nucleotide adenylyltransferase [Acidimicrobiaceae bacterium]MBT5569393.1 nicotinate (nicotinamide) nucleotide adenylyltransferase [Acidimicrobiaceae bacterium]MBT6091978.1 nicotinate (nicotinamide) nucleotide adenylyltransferase [Acidimicrobiaceae bacterium]MDG2160184.1 nicotinate (nicotinamide) nucleotide adenylyltransferase [Acidimicrobiales bacterium]